MIQCGLRKLPSPIVGDLRYLRRLSSSCDYSTKTLSQRYPDSRGCTLREGCDVTPLAVTLFVIFHRHHKPGRNIEIKFFVRSSLFKVYDRDLNSKFCRGVTDHFQYISYFYFETRNLDGGKIVSQLSSICLFVMYGYCFIVRSFIYNINTIKIIKLKIVVA